MCLPLRIVFFVCLLVGLNVANAQQTADKAANQKTKQVYAYIAGLPQQGKMLSGQFAGYSPGTFNLQQVNQISQQTGQTPAILGCDWASGWGNMIPPENIIDYSCNPSLKDHWNKGGLVTVNMHLPNPVSPNGGGYKDRLNLNFADLSSPQTSTGQRWRLFLDRMAQGLNDLQQAGVTVLFRPFHEMNGDWFYWCNQDATTFKRNWVDMFNYLTNNKNLHNIIWVYSPDQSRANPSMYYPGDAYVDIVALDVYTDEPNNMNGYSEMIGLNKPFALGEVGPQTTNGQFDYNKWLTAIETKFPKVAYFFAWNDGWSPITNKNAYSLYNHPRVINRGKINLGGNPSPPSGSSTVIYNFSNGIGRWTGTNVRGGPWQSNEFVVKSTDGVKADVEFRNGESYGFLTQDQAILKLSGYRRLIAHARVAPWGLPAGGSISAKLYIKGGAAWTWYDSGAVQVSSSAPTALTLDLTKVPAANLGDVREMGVTFTSSGNGAQSSIYLAYIVAEK